MRLQQTTCAAVAPRCIGLDNCLGWTCVAKQSTILCSWTPNDTPLQLIYVCNTVGGNQEANFSAGMLSSWKVDGWVCVLQPIQKQTNLAFCSWNARGKPTKLTMTKQTNWKTSCTKAVPCLGTADPTALHGCRDRRWFLGWLLWTRFCCGEDMKHICLRSILHDSSQLGKAYIAG